MMKNYVTFFKREDILAFFFVLMLTIHASATVKVAFIESRKPNGDLVQLEPSGKFYHIAISVNDKWLQAHPYYGVILSSFSDLEKMGTSIEVLELKNQPELSLAEVKYFLGKPYDREFSWFDDKIYCSELVAKLLRIRPRPMIFDPKLWPAEYEKYNGLPGTSPDYIYQCLTLGHCQR